MSENIIITFLSGLATGLISGLAIQRQRFNDGLKTGKINRLYPFLERAYPKIERLKQHSQYARGIQDNEETYKNTLQVISTCLNEYDAWFSSFKEQGMTRELDSINPELLSHLVGLYSYASQKNHHGIEYISQNIDKFSKLCVSNEVLLSKWLMR